MSIAGRLVRAEIVQPCVADSEVVCDLVGDGMPHELVQMESVAREALERLLEHNDAVWNGHAVRRFASSERSPTIHTKQYATFAAGATATAGPAPTITR